MVPPKWHPQPPGSWTICFTGRTLFKNMSSAIKINSWNPLQVMLVGILLLKHFDVKDCSLNLQKKVQILKLNFNKNHKHWNMCGPKWARCQLAVAITFWYAGLQRNTTQDLDSLVPKSSSNQSGALVKQKVFMAVKITTAQELQHMILYCACRWDLQCYLKISFSLSKRC